ncbi:hypothetical protein F5X99DRAFT_403497 [Biscogniauxia marginata]|nr:hypothetical protein F5X99DRAFT_403497 [Biscogniauxia marginata]
MAIQSNYYLACFAALLCIVQLALGAEIEGPDQGIDSSCWNAAISTPNATGTYPIHGFNISGAYSEEEVPGWSISIRVSADHETGWDDTGADLSGYFVATSISIQAPDSLLDTNEIVRTVKVAENPEWAVSVWPSIHLSEDITESSQNDNGSCLSFLPQQCIKDWQDEYVTMDTGNHAPPSSCNSTLREVIQLTNENNNTVSLQTFNGTELVGWSNTYDDQNRGADELRAAMRRIWSVMMVYRQSGQSGTASVAARLACIRARDVADGNHTTTSASSRHPVVGVWALGLPAAVVFLVL